MLTRRIRQARQPAGANLIAVPPELAELADRQAGVLTRRQLRGFGLDWDHVEAASSRQRWRTFGRNVVVLHNAPLSAEQRLWVAVLLPGKLCALAGPSAAAAGGLDGFETAQVHIVVPHGTHVAAPPWVKLHESRRFSADDIDPSSAPPRTHIARSIIDAAAWSRSPRRACAILCASVQQRLTTADRLAAELVAAGRVRHVAIMRSVLGDIAGGAHTLAEIDLGKLARRAGLTAPQRQAFRRDPDGGVRYLDAEFALPDGSLLVVEVDGRGHLEVRRWLDDLSRQNEVVIDGRTVLRFASLAIRLGEGKVVDQLRRMRLAHTPA
jgi:very-short-patch-repair endonuclease